MHFHNLKHIESPVYQPFPVTVEILLWKTLKGLSMAQRKNHAAYLLRNAGLNL